MENISPRAIYGQPTVTVDNLLEAVRRAKLYTTEQTDGTQTVNVVESNTSSNDALLNAIEGIRDTLNIHIQSTDGQFREQAAQINALSNQHPHSDNVPRQDSTPFYSDRRGPGDGPGNQYRGRSNRNRRNGRGGSNRGRQGGGDRVCFKCNMPNHIARNCTLNY